MGRQTKKKYFLEDFFFQEINTVQYNMKKAHHFSASLRVGLCAENDSSYVEG